MGHAPRAAAAWVEDPLDHGIRVEVERSSSPHARRRAILVGAAILAVALGAPLCGRGEGDPASAPGGSVDLADDARPAPSSDPRWAAAPGSTLDLHRRGRSL